jgi:hypothetical protein
MKSKQEYLEEGVAALLESRGWRVSKKKLSAGQVWVGKAGRDGYPALIVEYKALNVYRGADFRAAVGDAILRFRHGDQGAHSGPKRLLLAFLLQRMSRNAEEDLQEYSRAYLPDLQWILLAEDGSIVMHVQGQDARVSRPPRQDAVHREPGDRGSLFSPNNQWLFKVLLLGGMDPKYWGGPARQPESVGDFASLANVPQPSVSAFVRKAQQEGFLKKGPSGFVVQRQRELLDDWGYALKSKARQAINLRFLYPGESEEEFLRKLRSYGNDQPAGLASFPVAIGGHMGCHLLGLGRSNVRSARLYAAGGIKELLAALDLVEDPGPSGPVSLVIRRNRGSILRGAVSVDGVWGCDVLQCYFDVRFSYARGQEQADYIYERVLQPHFESRK